ncbi:MAG: HD-GYP domain-containing protein [bacterium]
MTINIVKPITKVTLLHEEETMGTQFEYEKALSRTIHQITSTIANIRLYSPSHPQIIRHFEQAILDLSELFRYKPEITFFLVDNDLIVDNKPFPSSGEHYITKFITILKENSIERLTFAAGLPIDDLKNFIQDLASHETTSLCTSPYIKLGKVEIRVNKGNYETTTDSEEDNKIQELLILRDHKLDELKELYHTIKRYKKIKVRGVDVMIKEFIKAFDRGINPFRLLASLKSTDEYTFTHVINVCILTMSQAQSLGFKGEHLYNIGIASILHDSGKLFIPSEIISKPGKLTTEERAIIETHTVKGARYIMGLEGVPKIAVLSALEHHIKFDGTGYPIISEKWIPNIVSQMITISDVFDAMRSKRPYQDPKPKEVIMKILREEEGTSFNPQLVEHFLALINK